MSDETGIAARSREQGSHGNRGSNRNEELDQEILAHDGNSPSDQVLDDLAHVGEGEGGAALDGGQQTSAPIGLSHTRGQSDKTARGQSYSGHKLGRKDD